jgi:hypothetical protein
MWHAVTRANSDYGTPSPKRTHVSGLKRPGPALLHGARTSVRWHGISALSRAVLSHTHIYMHVHTLN